MRNAYILIDFGDFVDGASSKTGDPYIQLLPLTQDLSEAHWDFVNVRQSGVDQTGNFRLLPASVLPPTDEDDDDDDDHKSLADKIHPYLTWIIAGSVLLGSLLLLSIALCIFRSRQKRYRPLQDPAPHGLDQHEPFTRYDPSRRY